MNWAFATAFGIAAAVGGLTLAGCEDTGGGDGNSGTVVTRDVMEDGTVRTVYEQEFFTGSNTVVQTTVITQPAGGPATTNITVTPAGGIPGDGGTNGTPTGLTPSLPGLPAGATPLPSAP
ncbi:MAG: hypothetical protein BWK77_03445 [Verrucomicrobia bacterium A1]|nr:MAG: hypothetical protein BWK77_03445 [Verrucomicrobia bacterium A1]